jgi:hypothetical protein
MTRIGYATLVVDGFHQALQATKESLKGHQHLEGHIRLSAQAKKTKQ